MPDQIFISYRRNDAAYVTGHINDRLRKEFGDEAVFTDVDNLALGVDFRTVLDQTVAKCHILLAVIGDNWIKVKNEDGKLRLHDPADFVRIEIESALQRNIPVIPLLVAGTKMPTEDELPDSLRNLAFRNGTQIRPAPHFHTDMDRLIKNLNSHLRSIQAEEQDETQAPVTSPAMRKGEHRQSLADVNPKRDADEAKRNFSKVNVRLEEEDTKRKQIELGTAPNATRKRSAARVSLIVIGLLVAAGASSFAYVKYTEQVQATNAALASIQQAAADAEVKREADAIAAAQREADAVAQAKREADLLAEESLATDAIDETSPGSDAAMSPDADPVAAADLLAAAEVILKADAEAKMEAEAKAKREADAIAESERVAQAQAAAEQRSAADAEAKRKIDATTSLREGISLAGLGDHEAAIQNYDEAIRLGVETSAFAYRQRGASYHALGDYQSAIEDYEEVLLLEPQDANVYYKRSASYYALRDYEAAINDASEAIRLDPEFAAAYINRSASHEALGNLEAAERDRVTAEELQSRRNDPP